MEYQPRLDSLRFFSVVFVIIYHWMPGCELVKVLPNIGGIGVGFFFVLSGYLITTTLVSLKHKSPSRVSIRIFYINRGLRIFPIYYVSLIIFLLLGIDFEENLSYLLLYLTNFRIFYLNNYIDMFSHLWSLAVEEQFYFYWPIVVLMIPLEKLNYTILITFFLSLFLKVVTYLNLNSTYIDLLPYSQFDLFMIGAYYSMRKDNMNRKFLTLSRLHHFFIFLAICCTVYFTGSIYLLKNLFLGLMSVFLIASMNLNYPIIKISDVKAFIFFGKISYGLYLYHNFIPFLVRNLVGTEVKCKLFMPILPNLRWPIYHLFIEIVLLLSISILSWYLIEKPLKKYKKFS